MIVELSPDRYTEWLATMMVEYEVDRHNDD
jgi:hypothetical protein